MLYVRRAAPLLYAAAVLLALFLGGGTPFLIVLVVGAVAVGAVYAITGGVPSRNPERARRRAARRHRSR